MKISYLYIFYCAFALIIQKLIFSDALMLVSDEFPLMIFIYPLIILSLPVDFDRAISLGLAFVLGLALDVLNDTIGINAFALVLTAYLRNPVLDIIKPKKGYKASSTSFKNYGLGWILTYLATMLFVHIFCYFSVDAFTMVYFKRILFSTIISVLATIPFAVIVLLLIKVK